MLASLPPTSPKVISTLVSADVSQFCRFFNFIEMDSCKLLCLAGLQVTEKLYVQLF